MNKLFLVFLLSTACLAAGTGLRCEVRGSDNKPIHFGVGRSNALNFLLFASDKRVRVFQEWNSWGYYNRTFQCTDLADSKSYIFSRRPRGWDKNAPSTHVLEQGQFVLTNIDFMDGSWQSTPHLPAKPQLHLRLTPRYQVEPDTSSQEEGAWVGKISGPSVEIDLDASCSKRLN